MIYNECWVHTWFFQKFTNKLREQIWAKYHNSYGWIDPKERCGWYRSPSGSFQVFSTTPSLVNSSPQLLVQSLQREHLIDWAWERGNNTTFQKTKSYYSIHNCTFTQHKCSYLYKHNSYNVTVQACSQGMKQLQSTILEVLWWTWVLVWPPLIKLAFTALGAMLHAQRGDYTNDIYQ